MLTFVNAPSRSGSDVIITWSANENVSAQCTVQTPTQITAQPCNMSWSGTNLSEGYHSIYVQLTDWAGNTASPFSYKVQTFELRGLILLLYEMDRDV